MSFVSGAHSPFVFVASPRNHSRPLGSVAYFMRTPNWSFAAPPVPPSPVPASVVPPSPVPASALTPPSGNPPPVPASALTPPSGNPSPVSEAARSDGAQAALHTTRTMKNRKPRMVPSQGQECAAKTDPRVCKFHLRHDLSHPAEVTCQTVAYNDPVEPLSTHLALPSAAAKTLLPDSPPGPGARRERKCHQRQRHRVSAA